MTMIKQQSSRERCLVNLFLDFGKLMLNWSFAILFCYAVITTGNQRKAADLVRSNDGKLITSRSRDMRYGTIIHYLTPLIKTRNSPHFNKYCYNGVVSKIVRNQNCQHPVQQTFRRGISFLILL